jgi:ABC-2 type transport system ATP-binding protein
VSILPFGKRRAVELARALATRPRLLLLDEPASGLDPQARIQMRKLLRRLADGGKTLLVSSHILPELADICNKIGIIDRGVMTVNAAVADVMKQVRERTVLNVAVTGDIQSASRLLAQHENVETADVKGQQTVVTLKKGVDDYSDLSALLVQHGHHLTLFQEEQVSLESAFMTLTKGMGSKT